MDPNIRIGDAERDEAISRLRAHHAAGRIDMIEFDDRMEKALEARTAGDLKAIFRDLPDEPFDEPAPAMPFPPRIAAHPYVPAHRPMQSVEARVTRPTYAAPGFFWIVFFVVIFTGMRLWPLLVLAAVWFWGVAPAIQGFKNPRPVEHQRFFYPAGDIDAELRALVHANRKIDAVRRFREVYGGGLREAKEAVDRIEREERGLGH